MALRTPLFLNPTEGFPEELAVASDTIDLGAGGQISGDLTFDNSGEVRGLPDTPTASDAATSKTYVDAIAVAAKAWKEKPLVDEQLFSRQF
jgi:hypothetical protein